MTREYYVYIMTNKTHSTLYIGVTNNLTMRVFEHKSGDTQGFTQKYNVNQLVYFQETNDIRAAIHREKLLKKWNRQWKERLINEFNPEWKDLAEQFNIPIQTEDDG